MSEYTPTTRIYGHGSITLTHYPSSGRVGVIPRGTYAVMDTSELLGFLDEAGVLASVERAAAERAWDEGEQAGLRRADFEYGQATIQAVKKNPYRREEA